jgi:hypothetical protein
MEEITLYPSMLHYGEKIEAVDKIRLLMGLSGYSRNEYTIEPNFKYMKVGYWRPISNIQVSYINEHSELAVIKEESWFDDDCGELYAYDILFLQGVV